VREVHSMPLPLYAAHCGPAPAHTRLTPATAQCALLPVAVDAMNIHDVHDRQTSDSVIA